MASIDGTTVQKQHPEVGQRLATIKHVILILSGKGGVGKSSVTAQLAMSLVQENYRVGVLDIDLCGPSIPKMLGLEEKKIHQASAGWVPVYADEKKRLACMSIGFLLPNKDSSVVWRGPKKNAMIKQFLTDVYWGELDYLLIDTPPGTSDEHLSVMEYLQEWNPDGAVLVTTPQLVALTDVRKEYTFCKRVMLPVLGVIENMSGFVCPTCSNCTNLFSTGGGEAMAKEFGLDFLGNVPIDPNLVLLFDQAKEPGSSSGSSGVGGNGSNGDGSAGGQLAQRQPFDLLAERYEKSKLAPIFKSIVQKLTSKVSPDNNTTSA
ncbi:cytosolic Fe-S cluster assembly factor cfd1 [Spiromyces aspiralis]|uniref:Cytosolic Fe-S cluster assembly factor cfd1 n=1 Tax=Spiromyces aspiralis TaxID=68401 RepID=A0ACC1HY86_9FUNG|nr:cytosolic Fe-S cluster assembly factor cfd1 [Spiromyces aspiralis]